MNIQPEFKLQQTDIATVMTEGYPYQQEHGLTRLNIELVTNLLLRKHNKKSSTTSETTDQP